MPPPVWRLLKILAGIALLLGIGAGVLGSPALSSPEYLPIVRAAMGLAGLGLGYLLGWAAQSLIRWRPAVPLAAAATALPRDPLGCVWIRGFAAGFWTLEALWFVTRFLFDLVIGAGGAGPMLSAIPLLAQFFNLVLCFAVPIAIARGMAGRGEGLPRGTPALTAGAAFAAGLWLCVATWLMTALFFPTSTISEVAPLLALVTVLVAAVGTPVLAQEFRPSLRGPAWSGLLTLLALGGAWLLYTPLAAGSGGMGPRSLLLWLLLRSLTWGGSLGAVLAVAAARRRAARAQADPPRRAGSIAPAVGGLGLFLLGLIPLGALTLFIAVPGLLFAWIPGMAGMLWRPPVPPPSSPTRSFIPFAAQPGRLPLRGPALATPAAGSTLTGPVWTFSWRTPPGAVPGDLYQIDLWPPGAVLPLMQLMTRTPSYRFVAPAHWLPVGGRINPQMRAARPRRGRSSGTWTWRVRVVRPGQGAGRWSEARRFTPR